MKTFLLLSTALFISTLGSAQNLESKLSSFNKKIDSQINIRQERKPRIGISSSNYYKGASVGGDYINSVLKVGAEPIIIPPITDVMILRNIITELDGLILIGGVDFNPSYYNEKPLEGLGEVDSIRDASDLILIKLAMDWNVPILAICRGEQGLNIARGGTLYQDIPSQLKNAIDHNPKEQGNIATHQVNIDKDSRLAKILGTTTIQSNSFHHQSVKDVALNFKAVAYTEDGVIEAIEGYPHRNIMAVQWHPEIQVTNGDTIMIKLFENLIKDANTYKKAKELHKRIISIDSHVDTPLNYKKHDGYNFASRDSSLVDLPKMNEGRLDAVFMAAYTGQGARDNNSSAKAVEYITEMVKNINLQATIHNDLCEIATTREDIIRLKNTGKKAILIGVENGYAIGKDIKNLQMYYNMGVRYMTLCHTKDNDICDTSSQTENEWGGLSPLGKKVVKEMNRLGMMIDVSHAGINTFDDVVKLSTKPIVATHSSVRNLCEHDRNLTDKQLKDIARNNGVVQVCMVDLFINSDNAKASLEDAMNHIDYIVKMIGIDHVGIGSDFDGGGRLIGLEGANDLINITTKLIERGYSDNDIEKIWGGNFLRVLAAQRN